MLAGACQFGHGVGGLTIDFIHPRTRAHTRARTRRQYAAARAQREACRTPDRTPASLPLAKPPATAAHHSSAEVRVSPLVSLASVWVEHPPPCARGPGASAPTAGQGLWVLVFAGACQGTAWAGLCLIHHHHRVSFGLRECWLVGVTAHSHEGDDCCEEWIWGHPE